MIWTACRRIRTGIFLVALAMVALCSPGFAQTEEKQTSGMRTESIPLKSVDADKIVAIVQGLHQDGKEPVILEVDAKKSMLVVRGTPEVIRAVKSIVELVDGKRVKHAEIIGELLAVNDLSELIAQSTATGTYPYVAAEGTYQRAPTAFSEYIVGAFREVGNETLGATLTPLADALRAQLKVPAGQGLLVSNLRSDGAAANAGLKQHDVLLTLGDQPLASADDLTKHLKAAGEAPVALKILRAGKKVTLQVRPTYRVTLGRAVAEDKKEFYIGVQLEALDDAMRAQLASTAKKGVLVSSVVDKSPAQAAGVKPHDIILEYGGKAIETPEALAAQVQAGKDQPTPVVILREGKTTKFDISAGTRVVETASGKYRDALRVLSVRNRALEQLPGVQERLKAAAKSLIVPLDKEADLTRQIEDLRTQVQNLRDTIDQLSATIKSNPAVKK